MPPKKQTGASSSRAPKAVKKPEPNPFDSGEEQVDDDDAPTRRATAREEVEEEAGSADQPEKTIPKELLTRMLHEFFAKDATRISRDANAAVGKYVDVFVREAIARTAVEKQGGFLEVS